MLSARRPTCLSTKPFWADSQIHLGSQASRANLYLRKGCCSGSQSTLCCFPQAEAQWFQGAFCTSKEFRPCLCHQRAQVCPAGTAPGVHHSLAASGRKPRCHGEMLADQHGFAHNRLCCIGGSFSDYLPNSNSSKRQVSW